MAVPESIVHSKGSWRGKYQLNLAYLPPDERVTESTSSLHVETDRQSAYATITYDWEHEGKREEGTLILCKSEKTNAVEFAWVDSWHQNGSVLHLAGDDSAEPSIKAKGSFDAEGQTWGWTIEFVASETRLVMKMAVLSPSGEEDWAVHATYERA